MDRGEQAEHRYGWKATSFHGADASSSSLLFHANHKHTGDLGSLNVVPSPP